MVYKKTWKYILFKDKSYWCNKSTYYRLRAIRNFSNIKKGDSGGYVKGYYYNLSHKGNCWIYDYALVGDLAQITDNAIVEGDARVFGNAKISENARVSDFASVYGEVQVLGNAWIKDFAQVHSNIIVKGDSVIRNDI